MSSNHTGSVERSSGEVSEDAAGVDQLVREAQAGSHAAFDGLVRAFAKPMYNLAYRMAMNTADADDLTQEIFVKLHASIRGFGFRSRFSTWLYALATNTCRSGLRRLRRVAGRETVRLDAEDGERGRVTELPDRGELPGEAVERGELGTQIESAVAALPEDFRLAVVLRDLQGLEYEEIVEATGWSMGTVKSRIARGRQRVKEQLVRLGVGPGGGRRDARGRQA